MKKQYRKPEIAIEDFVLNQFIAGSCTVKTNLRDNCFLDNYNVWSNSELLDPFTKAAIEAGQFIDTLRCKVNADDDNDTICYHFQGNPLFQS